MLGSELWAEYSNYLVKELIADLCMHGSLGNSNCDACPGPQSDSSGWDRGQNDEFRNGRRGKLSHSIISYQC